MDKPPFDLNLLRIFHAVYSARNVSRAAELIGMSQPAVSHGLSRLRLHLRDPLFLRAPGGVAPTAKADHFARFVEAALKTIDVALVETDRFDPLNSERRFVMHMSDLGEGEFLPTIMQHLQATAPRLRVEAVQLASDDVMSAMEQGRIDLAIGYLPQIGDAHHHRLLDDRYVVLTRRNHPQARRLRGKADLRSLEFILVKSHGEPAKALHRLGLEDQVRLTIPHFSVLPEILARTNLAAIVPHNPAKRFARQFGLQISEPPLGLPALKVWLHWYWRVHNDPGHRWLRDTIARSLGRNPASRTE